jgi:hypothetical protein
MTFEGFVCNDSANAALVGGGRERYSLVERAVNHKCAAVARARIGFTVTCREMMPLQEEIYVDKLVIVSIVVLSSPHLNPASILEDSHM